METGICEKYAKSSRTYRSLKEVKKSEIKKAKRSVKKMLLQAYKEKEDILYMEKNKVFIEKNPLKSLTTNLNLC